MGPTSAGPVPAAGRPHRSPSNSNIGCGKLGGRRGAVAACAAPTEWLHNLGLEESVLQTFDSLVVHTPGTTVRWPIGWTFSTFDYKRLCELLWEQHGAGTEFETAKVDGRTGTTIHTDRGDVRAPLTGRTGVAVVLVAVTPTGLARLRDRCRGGPDRRVHRQWL